MHIAVKPEMEDLSPAELRLNIIQLSHSTDVVFIQFFFAFVLFKLFKVEKHILLIA